MAKIEIVIDRSRDGFGKISLEVDEEDMGFIYPPSLQIRPMGMSANLYVLNSDGILVHSPSTGDMILQGYTINASQIESINIIFRG